MKTVKVSYNGVTTEQVVDEKIYNAVYRKAIDDAYMVVEMRKDCFISEEAALNTLNMLDKLKENK